MNETEKEQKKIYDDQTKAFMKDRKANAAEKIAPLKEEVAHKVGDTVYATHPVKRYTTMTGKVTRVGRTLTTLTHKDGTTGTYPHHDVNKDYEVLHPNPYKKNESVSDSMPSKDMISSMDNLRKTADSNRKVHLNNLLKRSKKPETIAHIKSLLAKNESVDEERNVTIGTTAWVKHPTDSKKRLSGKVTSVGKTHISLQHKDGTKEMYLHKDVAVASAKNESMDEAYAPGKTVYTSHMDKVLKGKVVEPDEEDKKFTIVNINGKRHSVHNDHIHSRAEHAGFMLEDVNEGKMVPTHSASGKPNPNHPAFATHKAKYDTDKKAAQQPRAKATPTESPVKLHHIDSAISNSYPDVEPYEHLARKFPDLHKAQGKTGSKLMDHLHDVVKKHKAGKDYHDYVNKAHADIKSDAEFDKRNESVDEALRAGKRARLMKQLSFSQYVKEGVFDWKANKSEVDWTDKKDKKTEKSAEGGTIHKAREGSRNAETGGKAAKKSVGRPAGKYDKEYEIDRAKRDTPEYKVQLSKKVMAAKAKNFATRKKDPNSDFAVGKDIQQHLQAAIKKRQEELWHADPANKK